MSNLKRVKNNFINWLCEGNNRYVTKFNIGDVVTILSKEEIENSGFKFDKEDSVNGYNYYGRHEYVGKPLTIKEVSFVSPNAPENNFYKFEEKLTVNFDGDGAPQLMLKFYK